MRIRTNDVQIMKEITEVVSDYYDVDLTEDTNRIDISKPRNICVHFIRKYTQSLSMEYIASKFNRGYSNFITQNKRLKQELEFNETLRSEINTLDLIIQSESKGIKTTLDDKVRLDIYTLLNRFDTQQLYTIKKSVEQTATHV